MRLSSKGDLHKMMNVAKSFLFFLREEEREMVAVLLDLISIGQVILYCQVIFHPQEQKKNLINVLGNIPVH